MTARLRIPLSPPLAVLRVRLGIGRNARFKPQNPIVADRKMVAGCSHRGPRVSGLALESEGTSVIFTNAPTEFAAQLSV
jgi:hypothetical protein